MGDHSIPKGQPRRRHGSGWWRCEQMGHEGNPAKVTGAPSTKGSPFGLYASHLGSVQAHWGFMRAYLGSIWTHLHHQIFFYYGHLCHRRIGVYMKHTVRITNIQSDYELN